MIVRIPSLYTGRLNQMELPVSLEQLEAWHLQGEPIFVAMPELNADQVDFLVSSMTPEERVARFGQLSR